MNVPLILIVDDEEQIAMFASMFLNRAGFKTIRTTSAREALDLFTTQVEVLLTDWTMPEMTGGELAARLQQRQPALRALFMSGNAELSPHAGKPLEVGVNLIHKPFTREELISFVRRALGERLELGTAPVAKLARRSRI